MTPSRNAIVSLVASWALRCCGSTSEPACQAGGSCKASGLDSYFWPTAHGHYKHYGVSAFPGPFNLTTSLAWSWEHPDGQYNDMPMGAAIDDKNNVYVSADQGIYKLNPDGKLVWRYNPGNAPGRSNNLVPDSPSLYNGAVLCDTVDGRVYSLDMETGKVNWLRQVAPSIGMDTGVVAVHAGVVVVETDASDGSCRSLYVRGLNVTNGNELWRFEPDNPLWDLMAQFLDDGTFVFQDLTGKVYRNRLSDGSNIWKSGGWPGSWTDGTQGLGPNGLVYGVNTNGCGGSHCHGYLSAYKVTDGSLVWQKDVPRPPNSSPVVGRLGKGDRLSVVMPIGQQPSCDPAGSRVFEHFPYLRALPWSLQLLAQGAAQLVALMQGDGQQAWTGNEDQMTDIMTFDAENGDLQWVWRGPTWKRLQCPGDEKGFLTRMFLGVRTASCPTPWGAPRIGTDGTVYAGNQNGFFYAINDWNSDGQIDPVKEVSAFDCEAEFSSAGSAHGDGMVVMASGIKVWAW
eukprot:CAMPEP_0180425230 /NCGR_PEP_ID=MMETSP1036_2-20121128/5155_1 /TAXON_ID=632150 /ORGANISM="Azadinium spinosum, Strain 3D9" /LENGTH=510 /DNA_ID=CAMNT_0022430711 /DNA_START=33 /DNA_END=1562 /DNA_ORIENTATION=+